MRHFLLGCFPNAHCFCFNQSVVSILPSDVITARFRDYLVDWNNCNLRRQIKFLKRIHDYIVDPSLPSDNQDVIRTQCLKHWKVEPVDRRNRYNRSSQPARDVCDYGDDVYVKAKPRKYERVPSWALPLHGQNAVFPSLTVASDESSLPKGLSEYVTVELPFSNWDKMFHYLIGPCSLESNNAASLQSYPSQQGGYQQCNTLVSSHSICNVVTLAPQAFGLLPEGVPLFDLLVDCVIQFLSHFPLFSSSFSCDFLN